MPPPVAAFRGATVDVVEVVELATPLGSFTAGAKIELSRIVGGHVGEPEAECNTRHLHAASGITIDGQGPSPDPNPTGCGFGTVLVLGGT